MRVKKELLRMAATLMLLTFCVFHTETARAESRGPDPSRQELRADRYFIKGDYVRAMKAYEKASAAMSENDARKLPLELKMARLYTALQNPEEAIRYYEMVYAAVDTMLTVNDVCFFIDALRQNGRSQEAEVLVRNLAFKNVYSRNQRYINTLYALSNQQHYYDKGNDACNVVLFPKSGSQPEYWLGKWNGELFYAVSHSALQDPLKIYYHRTQYFAIGNSKEIPFNSIPRELQSGPVAFSDDGGMMVATGISYRGQRDKIANPGDEKGMFVTQLYYSLIHAKSGGWSRFLPLFDYQEGYSYAHPTFFNDGQSLIFSSDRPGGYGGMDLYMANWNESTRTWDDPINLGRAVNTEGDEIYPRIMEGVLYFSSNGNEGFGGYDIYRIAFDRNMVLPGTLYHYPYPVNSSFNDFGMLLDGNTGYLISDRRGAGGKEDIYTFDNDMLSIGRDDFRDVSQEYSAMRGNLNLITGLKASNTEQFNKPLDTYITPDEGDILLSIYFDFNSSRLDQQSIDKLNNLLSDKFVNSLSQLSIIGYADEFGTQVYNKRLSEERAQSVARFLRQGLIAPKLIIEGRGQLSLSDAEYQAAAQEYTDMPQINVHRELKYIQNPLSLQDRIRINRVVRRVDIVVKKK